jgi:ABC-type transport system involved in multi-copper enzyme maturation permease subunit
MTTHSPGAPVLAGDFLPVASREARIASRRLFSYAIRSIIAAAFALVAFRRMYAPNVDAAGPPLLRTLGWMGFFYATLGGAFKTFDSLSREKREGTLGLLLLTDLKPFQILSGKLLAASALAVFGLLAFLPILSIPMIIGGVLFEQVVRLAVSLITALLLAMSWGLYVSANARNYVASLAGAAALIIVFAFVPLDAALHLNPASKPFLLETFVCLFTPTLPFALAFTVNPELTQFFWPSVLCNLALALAWICAGVMILPGRCHEAPAKSKLLEAIRNRFHQLRFGAPSQRTALRQQRFQINPVFWLANRDRVSSLGLSAVCVVTLMTARFFHVSELGLLIASLAILFRMAYASSHSISQDQKNGALELLLSTTLSIGEIVNGFNRAMLRRFLLPAALVILWPWAVPTASADLLFKTLFVCSSLLLIATWVALSWVGPWFALRKKPIAAAWTALAVVALPPWLIWIASIFRGLFDPSYADLQFIGAIVCCFVGVFHCVLMTRWAHQLLLANFRAAAADPFATINFEPTLSALMGDTGVTVVPLGQGNVHVVRWGRSARLVAIPGPNHVFVAWGGHLRGNSNPVDIELQGNAYIVARFAAVAAAPAAN